MAWPMGSRRNFRRVGGGASPKRPPNWKKIPLYGEQNSKKAHIAKKASHKVKKVEKKPPHDEKGFP